MESGIASGEHLDAMILQLKGIRRRAYGPRQLDGSGRSRILRLLQHRAGQEVSGEEIAEVAGISEWARRIRELRADGYAIDERAGFYRLN
jgi:biotin operon repressor